ncbi:transcription factor HES-5-like [Engraulis encrasicolus]|uniref:transcription factor HES-5-like n=1 Tax=Engraulis encrasicolus TaxID=184585 RepID=UPI002FD51862
MKPVLLIRFTQLRSVIEKYSFYGLQINDLAAAMEPTATFRSDFNSREDYSKDYMNLSHKVRKPIVEKLRRDRINNSIEELKALLGPQLQNQQPESKLEKADILEMTVCLLRQRLQQQHQQQTVPFSGGAVKGAAILEQEGRQPFVNNMMKTQSHATGLSHIQSPKPCFSGTMKQPVSPLQFIERGPNKSSPWRPW